jgi:hypothetical protein
MEPDWSSRTLGYIPFIARIPVRPVIEQTVVEKSDLNNTTSTHVIDLDGDWTAKLTLGRGWMHVEGVGGNDSQMETLQWSNVSPIY